MKRLIIFTFLLIPIASASICEVVHCSQPDQPRLVPRFVEIPSPQVDTSADAGFPTDGGLLSTRVEGHPMATAQRADDDARQQAEALIASRLQAQFGIPTTWTPPRPLLDSMIRADGLQTIEKDYGTVHIRTLVVDDSEAQLFRLAAAHEREIAASRLVVLGGGLAFVLVCLATLTGYIRADEATRGYHTRTLQLISLAAVGVSGAALYSWLV